MPGVEDLMVGQSRKMTRRQAQQAGDDTRTDPCSHGAMIQCRNAWKEWDGRKEG
jgi:hypothetical protein